MPAALFQLPASAVLAWPKSNTTSSYNTPPNTERPTAAAICLIIIKRRAVHSHCTLHIESIQTLTAMQPARCGCCCFGVTTRTQHRQSVCETKLYNFISVLKFKGNIKSSRKLHFVIMRSDSSPYRMPVEILIKFLEKDHQEEGSTDINLN